ncbi:hypothetical protein [Kitasatospora sp. NPDC008115]|uniref:hypothetical protein n=1 Tax=Kitasatospora sp. NPDC008115 TaxID=3364022 RepID=UPI0036E24253
MSRFRLATVTAALALLAATGLLTTASPASAGVADLTCVPPSSTTITYSPPLTLAPQTVNVNINNQYGPCVSPSHPAVTSGSAVLNFNATRSCLDLLAPSSASWTITWNTGQTSTLTGNAVNTVVGAAIVTVFTGNVSSGLFAGDSVVLNFTAPAASILLCTAGLGTVPGYYGATTLTITSL